jgi:hypothetical protein
MITPGVSCAAVLGATRDARAAYRSAEAGAGGSLFASIMDVSFSPVRVGATSGIAGS